MATQKQQGSLNSGPIPPAAILGEMVWLYSQSDLHQNWPFRSMHQWLLPAIMHKQYRIYHKGTRPVGFITWAHMSADVETAYVRNTRSLQPKDWQSGDRLWGLDLVAPFGDAKRILHDLRHNVFRDQVGRFLRLRKGDDTMRIMYAHGVNAVAKSQDRHESPTVSLGAMDA